MKPHTMETFGEIVEMEILSGTLDFQKNHDVIIEAIGLKNGICWKVTCLWSGGLPKWIRLHSPRILM